MQQMMLKTTAQKVKKLPNFCAKVTGQDVFLGDFLKDQDFAHKTGQVTGQVPDKQKPVSAETLKAKPFVNRTTNRTNNRTKNFMSGSNYGGQTGRTDTPPMGVSVCPVVRLLKTFD